MVVAGAGLIGLVTAWRAARSGLRVTVVSSQEPGAASGVAAGMLTPATEATFGEEPLMRFGLRSQARYPSFLAELAEDTALDPGYRAEGTLQVAFDPDDLAVLVELMELRDRLGAKTERLTSRECRRLEPMLAPSVRGGVMAPDDHSVDPRRLAAALRSAAAERGVVFVADRVARVVASDGAVRGVRLGGGGEIATGQVVLAAGAWSSQIEGLPRGVVPALRPVKGQLLRLRTPRGAEPIVTRTVRGLVKGSAVYLVPRADGEVVMGATQEEMGFDERLTAGGVWEILRDARELVPGITELEITESCVGLRPGAPDNEPLLGPTRLPGLHQATGHFRHGVLFAPATGDVMAQALTSGRLPEYASRFTADREQPGSAGMERTEE